MCNLQTIHVSIKCESNELLPMYQTDGSAGMDLKANIKEPIMLNSLDRVLIPTGVKIQLPKGFEAQVRPRSGLALKQGLTVLNSPGTIDSDYIGDIGVILINLSKEHVTINPGDRIAQLVVSSHEIVKWDIVDELNETKRGEGGFGHTGVGFGEDIGEVPTMPIESEEPGWVYRLRIEISELDEKIIKLQKFIDSSEYDNLDVDSQFDLDEQLVVMKKYCEILKVRLHKYETKKV